MLHYRCPNTGLTLEGLLATDPTRERALYEPLTCTACRRLHYVNPKTGKILGADEG
jgi:hypothetical protein